MYRKDEVGVLKNRTLSAILSSTLLSLFIFSTIAVASPFSFDASKPLFEPAGTSLIGTVTAIVPQGYLLYRSQISANAEGGRVGIQLPQGNRKPDPFGPGEIEIFGAGSWQIGVRLDQITATSEVKIEVGFQGCSTLTCFMPDTFEFRWSVPPSARPASPAPSSPPLSRMSTPDVGSVTTPSGAVDFGRTIQERGLVSAMLLAFFGGLLVSLTPCVYPMIPITLSIIGSRDENRSLARGFALSVLYVAGLSLTYALLGLAVASFGAHLRGVIQGPWFQGAMALVFAILALSMFDLFLLQVPEMLRQRLAGFRSGGTAGVFLTGMVSGLMASPCVAAPLAGILAYIASTGSALLGFMLLLAFAWGMGLILILLGTFSGVLNSLPRAGEWMNRVKEFYGFLLLGAALYFIRPLVGAPWGDLGVSLLLAGFAGFLGLFVPSSPETPLGERVRKCIGVVAL
ncbi:MAG TPA: cytochrome c biogenesis protein CcdA, partial [Candidatus Ozemobacteraceae bacterium]|nr:cytochrome c biogenesis protein CcdA [Candidatus Ozemobacteraceae bacterium]